MITHDLGVVAEIADDVVVMYAAKVVEQAHRRRHLPAGPTTRTRGACSARCRASTPTSSGSCRSRARRPRCSTRRRAAASTRAARTSMDVLHGGASRRSSRWRARRAHRAGAAHLDDETARRLEDGASCVAETMASRARRGYEWRDELLVVEDLKKHFPVTRGIIFQKQVASVKAVDGVSLHGHARARRSASSASPAAASRRWPAASCGCSTRPAARSPSTGSDITKLSAAPRCARSGAR